MSRFLPSEVTKYIDEQFAEAKRQAETGPAGPFYIEGGHATQVQFILKMVRGVPPHLITLGGDDRIMFEEAVDSLEFTCARWERGVSCSLKGLKKRGDLHPLAIIRKVMSTLHDEGIEPGMAGLAFIADPKLRDALRRDLTSTNTALANQEWKAATVLAGSVIEALLLNALEQEQSTDRAGFNSALMSLQTSGTFKKPPRSDLDDWDLFHLIEVAAFLKVISSPTADLCRVSKDFRNLIHPGRAARTAQVCDRGTALAAVGAVEKVVTDIS